MALSGKYVGTLNLGDERDFYSGLSKAVGYPQPNLRPAMEREHVRMLDSDIEFTTSNYEITTPSKIEWYFVVDPEEGRKVLRRSKAVTRDVIKFKCVTITDDQFQAAAPRAPSTIRLAT